MDKAELLAILLKNGWLPSSPDTARLARSMRALAASLGVNRAILARAITRMKRSTKAAAFIEASLPAHGAAKSDSPWPQPTYLRIAAAMRREMENHRDGGGSWPTVAQWCHRLGCHHRTATRALEFLEGSGVVGRRGRRWIQVTHHRRPFPATGHIYLGAPSQLFRGPAHFHLGLIQAIEEELRTREWGRMRNFFSKDPLKSEPQAARRVARNAFGMIYVTYGFNTEWTAFFKTCPHLPLVVADLTENQFVWGMEEHHGLRAIFRPSNLLAGRVMASHLVALGHTEAAFLGLGPATGQRWMAKRIQGLREGIGSVEYLALPEDPPGHSMDRIVKELRGEVNRLSAALGGTPLLSHQALAPIWELAIMETRMQALGRVLDAWLGEGAEKGKTAGIAKGGAGKSPRALVCAGDSLAFLAIRHLRRRGWRVPEDIRVSGFDNSPLAFHEDITSYDFRFDRMGRLCVAALAQGKNETRSMRSLLQGIRVEGLLVPRGSTD